MWFKVKSSDCAFWWKFENGDEDLRYDEEEGFEVMKTSRSLRNLFDFERCAYIKYA